ncbi:uncharacterized protein LOC123511502 [Portunus trituberculatus]|uniref:uncharacterized protein LOC123511502 n=1 Tax=Portunus trituberculatus TaxID=210409 RepID=UPI001E1CC989|nr:uncharacterized protein LOC123511502 [Portunus trituberculatus]
MGKEAVKLMMQIYRLAAVFVVELVMRNQSGLSCLALPSLHQALHKLAWTDGDVILKLRDGKLVAALMPHTGGVSAAAVQGRRFLLLLLLLLPPKSSPAPLLLLLLPLPRSPGVVHRSTPLLLRVWMAAFKI